MKKEYKTELLESRLWLELIQLGLTTSFGSNPQIVSDDDRHIQFVFQYDDQHWVGSADYHEHKDYTVPRYIVMINSIDYPVKAEWDSTKCDYVWIQKEDE